MLPCKSILTKLASEVGNGGGLGLDGSDERGSGEVGAGLVRFDEPDVTGNFVSRDEIAGGVGDGVAAVAVHCVRYRAGFAVRVVGVGDGAYGRVDLDSEEVSDRSGALARKEDSSEAVEKQQSFKANLLLGSLSAEVNEGFRRGRLVGMGFKSCA